MLKTRIYTVLVLLPLLLAALFFAPRVVWALLIGCAGLVGAWEWGTLAGWSVAGRAFFAGLVAVAGSLLWWANGAAAPFGANVVTVTLLSAVLFWVAVVPLWLALAWRVRSPLVLAVAGALVLVPAWLALVRLQAQPLLLLVLMGIVWVSDTAAYFAGHRWGQRKLAVTISPGKTWEGVFGAMVAVGLYCALVNALGWVGQPALQGAMGYAMFLLLMTLGIEGDLFESWIKRTAGVKDSGSMLPGHGGVLDRVDALTASMPAAALLLSVTA